MISSVGSRKVKIYWVGGEGADKGRLNLEFYKSFWTATLILG